MGLAVHRRCISVERVSDHRWPGWECVCFAVAVRAEHDGGCDDRPGRGVYRLLDAPVPWGWPAADLQIAVQDAAGVAGDDQPCLVVRRNAGREGRMPGK